MLVLVYGWGDYAGVRFTRSKSSVDFNSIKASYSFERVAATRA